MIYQVFLLLFNSCLTLPELERAWWRHWPSQQCPVCWVPAGGRDCNRFDAKRQRAQHCGSSLFAALTLKHCWKQFFFSEQIRDKRRIPRCGAQAVQSTPA